MARLKGGAILLPIAVTFAARHNDMRMPELISAARDRPPHSLWRLPAELEP